MTSLPLRHGSAGSRGPAALGLRSTGPAGPAPFGPVTAGARSQPRVQSQDEAHGWVRTLLAQATDEILDLAPELRALEDHRPQRDRPSGITWRGLETMCHVSALLASDALASALTVPRVALLRSLSRVATASDLERQPDSPLGDAIWEGTDGARLELGISSRVTVRAISGPFLPGTLEPVRSTSPVSPLSPVTPPPRPVR